METAYGVDRRPGRYMTRSNDTSIDDYEK